MCTVMPIQLRGGRACAHVQQSARLTSRRDVRSKAAETASAQRTIVETNDGVETVHTLGKEGQWEDRESQHSEGSKRSFAGLQGQHFLSRTVRCDHVVTLSLRRYALPTDHCVAHCS